MVSGPALVLALAMWEPLSKVCLDRNRLLNQPFGLTGNAALLIFRLQSAPPTIGG